MKVVIIEDEQLAARRLENMIHSFDPGIVVMAKLESVEESVEWFRGNPQPDLIFLDIHLEDDLSFVIFDKVEVNAPIIFTTAFDEYAIRAFKLKSIDYLLKPIIQEELNNAIKKYNDLVTPAHPTVDLTSLYDLISKKNPEYKERFSIVIGQKIKTFTITEIAYFYSAEGITFVVLKNKSEYPIDDSLEVLSRELNPKDFFRINRKFLVKIDSIANVHIYPKSHLKLDLAPAPQDEVFVSIDKVTPFKNWLDNK
ncbi:MAG: response regulator transcription factor [Bacteroidetes bacterium]|nr:response regulator transcription factor [Bacteroidota bacterium]